MALNGAEPEGTVQLSLRVNNRKGLWQVTWETRFEKKVGGGGSRLYNS